MRLFSKKILLPLLVGSLLLTGCSSGKIQEQKKTVYAMDTIMDLTAYTDNSDVLNDAEKKINEIDKELRRGSQESEIYAVNNNEETKLTDETAYIVETALNIGKKTSGAFDITIAPVMDLWGFYNQKFYVPTDDEIKNALKTVDYIKVSIKDNVISKPKETQVDLGGIAKGYTSDTVIKLLKDEGVTSAIISLGGNVQTLGTKPDGNLWKVAIQDPFDQNKYVGGVKVSDKAVITSGGYQRYFVKDGVTYEHIVDPKTGKPATSGLSSVTIVTDKGIEGDGLSTALFVMGLDKATEYWRENQDFQAVFITTDGKIYVTEGLKDSYFSDRDYSIIEK